MAGKYMINSRAPFASTWTKSYSLSLTSALEAAWRKHNRDWSIDSIMREQRIVINRGELIQAFAEMENLAHDQPKRSLHEISEQAIQGIDKAILKEETDHGERQQEPPVFVRWTGTIGATWEGE